MSLPEVANGRNKLRIERLPPFGTSNGRLQRPLRLTLISQNQRQQQLCLPMGPGAQNGGFFFAAGLRFQNFLCFGQTTRAQQQAHRQPS